jgi:hypothetical protein
LSFERVFEALLLLLRERWNQSFTSVTRSSDSIRSKRTMRPWLDRARVVVRRKHAATIGCVYQEPK